MRFICATDPRSQACGLSGQPGGIWDDLNVEALEYVTLSYVRGSPTDEEWDHNGLPEVLPPLLTDAIAVTKSLGFRYLWIDRFCFPQYNAHERRRQLEKWERFMLALHSPSLSQLAKACKTVFPVSWPTLSGHPVAGRIRKGSYHVVVWSLLRRKSTFSAKTLHCHESISFPLQTKPALNLGRVFPDNGAGGRTGDFRNIVSGYMDNALETVLGLPLFHEKDFKNMPSPTRTDRLAVGLGWLYDPPGNADISTHPLQLQGPFPSWSWLGWKLRPEYTGHGPNLSFYQVGEEAPVVDNISAVPI
ncbi:hypothetical protein ACKAV7_004787 [Fusarium commune]